MLHDSGFVQVSREKVSVHWEIQASWRQPGKPYFEKPEKDYHRYDLNIDVSLLTCKDSFVRFDIPDKHLIFPINLQFQLKIIIFSLHLFSNIIKV